MRSILILAIAVVAFLWLPLSATIINVPADQATIQAGINASMSGDTVRVAPGTYVENIIFSGKNIVVGSWFINAGDTSYISSTIIDGNQAGTVVSFINEEDNTAVITGFTIQNGYSSDGGGIICDYNSSPTISNNTISGNSASFGGGISSYYANPTVSNNTISGNAADDYGGGILGFNGNPTISSNTVTGNSSDQYGGGIYCYDSSPIIANTILWGDSAPAGPEIYLFGTSSPVITYSDVQGGWSGEGNIDCDPMFCDPENGNFYLFDFSCCLGAGEDGADIGALGAGCHRYLINIPADYGTIQEGINASLDGDTVRVAPGTYVENIDFSGKNIVVGSWFIDDGDTSYISSTIIDGDHSGSVVTFSNSEGSSAIITGFTIQNGFADYGGGIYCHYSSPTISHNAISENSAGSYGGGIYCSNSDPTISYNTMSGNTAHDGGAIECLASSPTISNNVLSGNIAYEFGGGIDCWNSSPIIIDNTITGNSSGQYGGGILCYNTSSQIANTIFWGDSAPSGPEVYVGGPSLPVITYCDVQGGWSGEGNINCNPMFCDPENNNYYLYASSCCIGAGEGGADIGAFGAGCRLPYTINIPADYETIQEGINASIEGDTVRVAPGTYIENIDFIGKNIVVGSWFLDIGDSSYILSTIIDGNQSGSVVTFQNEEDNSAVIAGFTIQNGNAQFGGGIFCHFSSPTISNNVISENAADYIGGGIYCWENSNATIAYNTINGNSTENFGGGIGCSSSGATISNNTIYANSASQIAGGVLCLNSSPQITNTIFWNDSAPTGPEIDADETSSPVITYCEVQGGWEGEGNIDCDPLFCEPEDGNFYLADVSCCLGAGESGGDIGAFGAGCRLPYTINVPADYGSIQAGINASIDGDTIRVAPGTYFEHIYFSGKNIVIGSWFLDNGDTSYISSTIIDGAASGPIVTFVSGEDSSAIICGLTIQDAMDPFGDFGAIRCVSSDPTIKNNAIKGNSVFFGGGAISCHFSNPTISNNTITANSSDLNAGGIYCHDSSPVITNSILWNYGDEIYLEGASSPIMTYCDIEGGWEGEGNIDCNPMFCDFGSSNYYLNAASCCVGAGEGGVNIGAFGVGCGNISLAYLAGDANMYNEYVDVGNPLTGPWRVGGDVTFLVNYFDITSGNQPCLLYNPHNADSYPGGPVNGYYYASADATGEGLVTGGDVSRLVAYFGGTAEIKWYGWDKPDPENYYQPMWLNNRGSGLEQPVPPLEELPEGWPNCQEPAAAISIMPGISSNK